MHSNAAASLKMLKCQPRPSRASNNSGDAAKTLFETTTTTSNQPSKNLQAERARSIPDIPNQKPSAKTLCDKNQISTPNLQFECINLRPLQHQIPHQYFLLQTPILTAPTMPLQLCNNQNLYYNNCDILCSCKFTTHRYLLSLRQKSTDIEVEKQLKRCTCTAQRRRRKHHKVDHMDMDPTLNNKTQQGQPQHLQFGTQVSESITLLQMNCCTVNKCVCETHKKRNTIYKQPLL